MDAILERLRKVLENKPGSHDHLHALLAGRVHYGVLERDPSIVIRVNEDKSETYGRFAETGDFIPFTSDEYRAFKRKSVGKVLPFTKLSLVGK